MRAAVLAGLALMVAGLNSPAVAQFLQPLDSEQDSNEVLFALKPEAREWPRLTINEDPEVCAGYLRAMQASFETTNFQVTLRDGLEAWGAESLIDNIDPYSNETPRGARPIVYSPANADQHENYALIKVDLDNDGAEDGLVVQWWYHSWRGYNYALSVFPPSASEETDAAMAAGGTLLREYVSAGDSLVDGSLWLPPTLVQTHDGAVYLYTHYSRHFLPDGRLRQINATGLSEICAVQVYPEAPVSPYDVTRRPGEARGRVGAASDQPVHTGGTRGAFSELMANVLFSQGQQCSGGTSRPLSRLQSLNRISRLNFMVRPWAMSAPNDHRDTLRDALESWSFLDPWSRRVYLDIVHLYPLARDELRSRLIADFGVAGDGDVADRIADELLYRMFGSHYQFGSSGSSRWRVLDDILPKLYRDELAGPGLETAFAAPETDPADPGYLFAVLDRPHLVERLIGLGASVDASNDYGKTALMYAAHLDYGETVARLLALGADVNAKTIADARDRISVCWAPKIGERTALTYAVENASLETIQALLDAGADPSVRLDDTPLVDLLSANSRLSTGEKTSLRQILSQD